MDKTKFVKQNYFKYSHFDHSLAITIIHIFGFSSGKTKLLDFFLENDVDDAFITHTISTDYRIATFNWTKINKAFSYLFVEYSKNFIKSIGGLEGKCFNSFLNNGKDYHGIILSFENNEINKESILLYFIDMSLLMRLIYRYESTKNYFEQVFSKNNQIIYIYNTTQSKSSYQQSLIDACKIENLFFIDFTDNNTIDKLLEYIFKLTNDNLSQK
jgi:hypothetical protein